MKIPMLADGAGAVSKGAVARFPSSRYYLILVRNSSSEKFSFCSTSSWRKLLLNSAIFFTTKVPRRRSPWLEGPTGTYAKRFWWSFGSRLRVTVSIGVGDASLSTKIFYKHTIILAESGGAMERLTKVGTYKVTCRGI